MGMTGIFGISIWLIDTWYFPEIGGSQYTIILLMGTPPKKGYRVPLISGTLIYIY